MCFTLHESMKSYYFLNLFFTVLLGTNHILELLFIYIYLPILSLLMCFELGEIELQATESFFINAE